MVIADPLGIRAAPDVRVRGRSFPFSPELRRRLAIHPVQYGLVGLALGALLAALMLATRRIDWYLLTTKGEHHV